VDETARNTAEKIAAPVERPSAPASAHAPTAAPTPPVLVLNPYYSGLGVARALSGTGVPVYALSSETDAPGVKSRYFTGVFPVPNGRDEPARLGERLLELRKSFTQRPVLFPTRDFDVLFLNEYRDTLAPHFVLPQPTGNTIVRVMDKLELARVAARDGIPAPATSACSSAAELEALLPALHFPLIVKPRFAYQWRHQGVWEHVGAQKAIIVASADELRAHYRKVEPFTREVLLQQYIPGVDSDIVICGLYIDRAGNVLGHFTGRKIRQNPPLVGTGCLVEACSVEPIVAPSAALLKAFGYAGLAEVEYKLDRNTGTYHLIEINARHWDQHELGRLVGVNLTRIAYRDMVGTTPPRETPDYTRAASFRWIAETELLQGTVQNLRAELRRLADEHAPLRRRLGAIGATLRELLSVTRGSTMFAVASRRDPRPTLALCGRLFRSAFSALRPRRA
jgi:predicted ATP-grasp superfamily ATP-dependent carboligase